jgi:phosphate starvation-inducible PhoH-like protein
MQILNACAKGDEEILTQCYAERIKVSSRRKEVIPGTLHQLEYLRAIKQHDIVFGIGPAGTGKTYLAMAMAVSSLLTGTCERIILTRPAVEAGENLGFLPGNLQDKINPYLRPLYDALYCMLDPQEAASFTDKGIIEVAPLAFMRGRTLNHAFVILDEAQNATGEQMLMFLTRLGAGSKCVICGDPSQTDLPRHRESGLLQALDRLHTLKEIGICRFNPSDVLRHTLVEKIIRAYDEYDGTHFAGRTAE